MTGEEFASLRNELRRELKTDFKEMAGNLKQPVSSKLFITLSGLLFAGLAAVAAIQTTFIVPSIMNNARSMVDELITAHENRTHTGSVTQQQMATFVAQMDKLATKESTVYLSKQVEQLREQLEKVEKKIDDSITRK